MNLQDRNVERDSEYLCPVDYTDNRNSTDTANIMAMLVLEDTNTTELKDFK